MDSFTGMKALRKTIELILGKLNMVQETMNELSREELLEIMANNDLDLSWIASQESVDRLQAEINQIKKIVTSINKDTMRTVGTAAEADLFINTISGNYIILYGSSRGAINYTDDITIYSEYTNGSGTYSTKIATAPNANVISMFLTKCPTLTIQDMVTFDGSNVIGTPYGALAQLCQNNDNLTDVYIGNCVYINTSNANSMFENCSNLMNIVIDKLQLTSSGSTANNMFAGCSSLLKLDLRNVDLSKLASGINMFKDCINLSEILVSKAKWIPDSCTTTDMFLNCGVDHVTYVD